jgi:hypothetical protein
MKDIRSRVLDYNAEWLRSEATKTDREEFADHVLRGEPTRTITLDPLGNGWRYRVTVTDGIHYKDGFAAAEDPKVFTLHRLNGREDMEAVARRTYGRSRPEGFELRVVRHH